jgi:hypothetical protein
MASSSQQRAADDMWSLHSTSQDSAVQLAEQDTAANPTPTPTHDAPEPPDDPQDAPNADEPPPYDDVSDSGFDSESLLGDETDTLASSIMNYRIENGRQYHSYRDGAYWGPNDEPAKEILDFAHHMYLLTLDHKLHLAPIKNPQVCMSYTRPMGHSTATNTQRRQS